MMLLITISTRISALQLPISHKKNINLQNLVFRRKKKSTYLLISHIIIIPNIFRLSKGLSVSMKIYNQGLKNEKLYPSYKE